jgi:hypothetical protein
MSQDLKLFFSEVIFYALSNKHKKRGGWDFGLESLIKIGHWKTTERTKIN